MSARWRWMLAVGFSVSVLFGGLVLLFQGGPDFEAVAWLLVIIGALSAVVNLLMRNRFVP
jgi:hypothetical protein